MDSAATSAWWAPVLVGELRLELCAGAAPPGWPAGRAARLAACGEAGPAPAGTALRPLAPARGAERAYRVLARALAADGAAGVLRVDGGGELRLVSLGAALVLEVPEAAEEPQAGVEVELARALLRAMPRRLAPRAEPGGEGDGPPAPVVDLGAARARRAS